MDETKCENKPTYEELLEFRKKHQGLCDEYLRRTEAARAEYEANLSRTWTGRLVLLARSLDVDWVAVFAFACLASVNLWIVFGLVCAALGL